MLQPGPFYAQTGIVVRRERRGVVVELGSAPRDEASARTLVLASRVEYMPAHVAAKLAGVSVDVFNRVTASVLVEDKRAGKRDHGKRYRGLQIGLELKIKTGDERRLVTCACVHACDHPLRAGAALLRAQRRRAVAVLGQRSQSRARVRAAIPAGGVRVCHAHHRLYACVRSRVHAHR
jgi:hypothetical protein